MDTLRLAGEQGTLTLSTGVEGRAAKMGHRLTIAIRDWEATATFTGDQPASAQLRGELGSFEVVKGEGGVKPLSDKDRATIRENALKTLKADQHPQVVFTSDDITPTSSGYRLSGQLSVAGVTRPTTVDVVVQEGGGGRQLRAEAEVVQSAHGIAPYSAMMGGLKVSDVVGVRFDATVPQTTAPQP